MKSLKCEHCNYFSKIDYFKCRDCKESELVENDILTDFKIDKNRVFFKINNLKDLKIKNYANRTNELFYNFLFKEDD